MDRDEIEEGITWKGLHQSIDGARAGKEAEAKVNMRVKDQTLRTEWKELLKLLLVERSFFSLRRDDKGNKITVREATSRKVLDCFFEKAWERPILKSHHSLTS